MLEPEVDALMVDYQEEDARKYTAEHEECDFYYDSVTTSDIEKFEMHYDNYKEAGVRFHKLKQEDAITAFLDRMNSVEFVNPETRQKIFSDLRNEQQNLFDSRSAIINQLHVTRPTALTAALVTAQEEKLRQFNEESSLIFERLIDSLAKDMENTNEDIDIAEFDLQDFLQKNDAELEEGDSFDKIMERRIKPTIERRKLESKTLVENSIAYMEDNDYKMGEICQNIIAFYKEFAKRLDTCKEKLKQTEV